MLFGAVGAVSAMLVPLLLVQGSHPDRAAH